MVLDQLNPGARILDLGCGTGTPTAVYLLERGFRVVGLDSSAKMLEIARRVAPEAELIHGDILEADFSDVERFAAIIAWDSLFHVERGRHREVFGKLHGWLEDDGWLVLSVGGSSEEGFTSEMFGHSFFYSGHEPRECVRMLETEGFYVKRWEVDQPQSRGHVAIVANKPCQVRR
jgi:cyclopropane fatty-acyl-phospholipid synthase-like methyltransferase